MGAWVRDPHAKPKRRRLVISYLTGDPANADLEAWLDRVPYGKLNEEIQKVIRAGLRSAAGGSGAEASLPPAAGPAVVAPSPVPQAVAQPVAAAPAVPEPARAMNEQKPAGQSNFSRSARSHFEN